MAFETKYFVSKELDIRGSRNALPEDFRAVMEYVKRNEIPDILISGIIHPKSRRGDDHLVGYPGKVVQNIYCVLNNPDFR